MRLNLFKYDQIEDNSEKVINQFQPAEQQYNWIKPSHFKSYYKALLTASYLEAHVIVLQLMHAIFYDV